MASSAGSGILDKKTGIVYSTISEYRDAQGNEGKLKLKKEKAEKKKELLRKEKPPKHVTQKEEYVQTAGTGHEASAAGGYGGDGRDGKKDHDGAGAGDGDGGDGRKGGGGGGGGKKKKKKKEDIYCVKCEHFFFLEDFENHDCKKDDSTSNIIDG